MRTIKFRGKRIKNGEWLYGDLMQDNEGGYHVFPNDCDGLYKENKVDTDTIGQFTGLFDKSGNEIYEGDVIKYTRYKVRSEYFKKDFIENVYVVYWNEEKHAFYCATKFENGGGASGYLNFHDERAEKEEIEVIGNIHDNPELIKD